MTDPTSFKPLSEAIFEPVNKAYKLGGLALTFLSLGTVLMLVAFLLPRNSGPTWIPLVVGLGLIAGTCVMFYVREVRPLLRAQGSIRENREFIDELQQVTLELTELVSSVQALAFKHAGQVSVVYETVMPQIRSVPVLSALLDRVELRDSASLYRAIVDASESSKRLVADVKVAVSTSDATHLKQYISQIQALRQTVNSELRGIHTVAAGL